MFEVIEQISISNLVTCRYLLSKIGLVPATVRTSGHVVLSILKLIIWTRGETINSDSVSIDFIFMLSTSPLFNFSLLKAISTLSLFVGKRLMDSFQVMMHLAMLLASLALTYNTAYSLHW